MKHSRLFPPAALLVFLLLLNACSKSLPDEQRIADAMAHMQQAADNKQLASLMQYFHDRFRGRHNMSKRELQARIYFHFRNNPKVAVFVSHIDITVKDNLAEVNCHLLVTGSQNRIPDRGRLYRIHSSWQ